MDVTPVVAGHVLAQRVEAHVRVRQLLGRVTLEVVDEAGLATGQVDRAGMDEDLARVRPQRLTPGEPERVALHRLGRPDRHDRPPLSGDHEGLVELGVGEQRRHPDRGDVLADREVEPPGEGPAATHVAYGQGTGHALADDDVLRRHLEGHREGRTPQREQEGDEDQRDRRHARDPGFGPGQQPPGEQQQHPGAEHHPPGDAHAEPAGQAQGDGPYVGPARRGDLGGRLPPVRRGRHGRAVVGQAGAGRLRDDPGRGHVGVRGCRGHAHTVRSVGGWTSLMIFTITSFAVTPLNSDSGSSTMRCARHGIARIFTSSGTT